MSHYEETAGSSSNKTLIIVVCVIGVVLIIVLAGCVGAIWFIGKTATEVMKPMTEMIEDMQRGPGVADSFLADVRGNRLQAAYDSTTAAFRARMTRAEFDKLVKDNPALQQPAQAQGPDMNQPGGNPQAFPSVWKFRYTAQAKEGKDGKDRIEFTVTVAKEEGVLKVDRLEIFKAVSP